MPRTGGQLTRARIVKRAAEMFRVRTFHSVSVGDILKSCAISKGTFYFYFESKQALAEQVVDYYAGLVPPAVEKCFADVTWPRGVDNLIGHFAGSVRRPAPFGTPLANLGLEVAYSNPTFLERIARVLKSVEERLADALSRHGMPRDEAVRRAASILAVLEGHLMRLTLTRDPRFARNAAAVIKRLGRRASAGPALACPAAREAPPPGAENCVKIPLDIVDDRSIIQRSEETPDGVRDKRYDILRCAAEQFGREGYHATSVEDILDACGIPKGSFQSYFAGKRDLAVAVLSCYRVRCIALADWALSRRTWPETVSALCAAVAASDMSLWRLGCPLGNIGMELAGAERDFAGVLASIFQTMEDRFARRLREFGLSASRARRTAADALAFWQGHIIRMIIYGDVEVARHLREDLLHLLC
jgi:TetR/AcrR family transcriptional repressor of nem operon